MLDYPPRKSDGFLPKDNSHLLLNLISSLETGASLGSQHHVYSDQLATTSKAQSATQSRRHTPKTHRIMALLSQHPALRPFSGILGAIGIAFGINGIMNPMSALSFFNLNSHYPKSASDPSKKTIDALLLVYGIRDIFMGLSVVIAAWYGHVKVLGWLLLMLSGVAGFDGLVCRWAGVGGEWNHWGYSPVGTGVGLILLGVFDRVERVGF